MPGNHEGTSRSLGVHVNRSRDHRTGTEFGHRRSTRPLHRCAVVIAAVALLAVACGGGESGDGSSGGGSGENEGEPTPGGELVYGLVNETSGGWCLPEAQLTISGEQVARTIYDTLVAPGEGNKYVPFLAESVEPNDDYTEWTIKLRDGIKFHDGTDLDATVVKNNLDAYRGQYPGRTALLFQFVFQDIASVDVVDDMTVSITTKVPWVALPATLYASGRIGIMAQAQLDDKDHCDTNLIGTGPFKLDDWVVNDHLTASKNADYWQTDSDGTKLPYLDKIVYKPFVDSSARLNALQSGELQAMHTNEGDAIEAIKAAADDDELTDWHSDMYAEVGYLMFNVSKPPFDSETARRAVTTAMNRPEYNKTTGLDQFKVADGPFAEGVIGYLPDTGFPEYDLEEAKKLVVQYESETGKPLEFKITGDNSTGQSLQMSLIQDMMKDAGIEVTIEALEESQQIDSALGDDWNAQMWRNHPGDDPDMQYNWWYSNSPVNFGRFSDPEVDALLDKGRQTPDGPERTKAYEDLNRLFAKKLYNLWQTWSNWTVGTQTDVHGMFGPKLPDGTPPIESLATGHPVSGMWISQ